ncbi:MAG: phosphotransferase [Ketobacteraceae bacterium]|nr:phosphotransferase [Ketobacteraceae bacterium]
MKPHALVVAPRYSFTDDSQSSAFFKWQGRDFAAVPLDVSKSHLSISVEVDEGLPPIDEPIDTLSVNIYGQNFSPLKCVVSKIEMDERGKSRIVFKSSDPETTNMIWEMSYLLRTKGSETQIVDYDHRELPKIPGRGLYTEDARQERLAFLREQTNQDYENVAQTTLDPKALVSNIEAFIGSVEVPVGLAGPLYIRGAHANGLYYAPMATSEGALVASVTRGATAISKSGGIVARVLNQRMMRAPVFVMSDINSAFFFAEWIKDHFDEIKAETKKYSNYADLVELETQLLGKAVSVQFVYETGDAAGQNMTTTCTWQASQWIMKQMAAFDEIRFDRFFIDSNRSNDKKVTYQSFIKGRGIRVVAECVLTAEVCRQILKVDPVNMVKNFHSGVSGGIATGMVGMNVNIANVIGAMFAATGQDIACVHESSIGQVNCELTDDGGVYATMMLPSLVIGTVGGGTNLIQQKECLAMMDCAGAGKSHKLAEIIASYCLALDLSTMSAIASDHFARAHETLGRNRPVDWLKLADFNTSFFNRVVQSYTKNPKTHVSAIEPIKDINLGSSIITELTAHKINKLVGHFPFELKLSGEQKNIKVMVKVKPLDDEVILVSNGMASLCDARLAQSYNKFKEQLEFKYCDVRELEVMSQDDPRFTKYTPTVYYTWAEPKREAYVIVEEFLEGMEMMDSADDTSGWTEEHLFAAIDGIAEVHSIWYGKEDELREKPWLANAPTQENMMKRLRLWEMLAVHASEEFPEWFPEGAMDYFRKVVYMLPEWYGKLDNMPKTLIHNDFNPRNICFRRTNGELRLCAYDWELATIQVPQHDVAELMVMTLQPDVDANTVHTLVERHRKSLEQHTGQQIDPVIWREGYKYSLWDLGVNRISMYMMGHTFRHYEFMERVHQTLQKLLRIEAQRES